MGSYTPNIGLYKPDAGELNWHEPLNQNFDIIDEKIGELMSMLEEPLEVIQTREKAIIDGKAYYAFRLFRNVPDGEYISMLFVNPEDSGVDIKIDSIIIVARYDGEFRIWQDPDVINVGDEVTPLVYNLSNIKPPKAKVYAYSSFENGLLTLEDILTGGHTRDAVGSTTRYNNFVICPPGTKFGLDVLNNSGRRNDICIRIEWREDYP